jgi:putative alpha-1,2-mannosidase
MFTTATVSGTSTTTDAPVLDKTLVDLYGSKQALLSQLHELLVIPSNFRVGSYNQEIHEMTEMRALAMGQYGHNNQPSHHIPYLFAILGDQETTQRVVRAVMERAYGRDFYAGDEDNGEQVPTVQCVVGLRVQCICVTVFGG